MSKLRTVKTPLSDHVPTMMRQVAADLRAIEKCPDYRVDMHRWHDPDSDGVCSVCAAGASMARRFGVLPDCFSTPSSLESLGDGVSGKLRAIEELRTGDVRCAQAFLPSIPESVHDRCMPLYKFDPEAWHKAWLALADEIEAAMEAQQ